MKFGSTKTRGGYRSENGNILTDVARRLTSLEARYPSASQSLLSILDQALVSGTSFVTAAIIGRMTSPDELGLYYLALSMVLIASGILDQVVAAPYLVYSKRLYGRELAEYSGSMWLQQFALTLLTVATLLAAIVILSATGQSGVVSALWALLGAAPLLLLRQAVRRFTFANLLLRSTIALDAIVAAVQLGALVVLGHLELLSLFSIYAVMGAACGIACLAWLSFDRPRIRFASAQFWSDWRRNWAFAKWALRGFLVGNTTPFVMLWILGLTVGATAAGVLGACATLIGMTNVLLSGVDNVLTPQASHAYTSGGGIDLWNILSRTGMFLAVTLGGFFLLILLTGDWLAILVFGAQFQGSGSILASLALSALMSSLGMVAANGLWAIDRPRSNFVADVFCMIATLIVAALLIRPFGALGAALAMLAGTFTATSVRIVTILRYFYGYESESLVLGNQTNSRSAPSPSAQVLDVSHPDDAQHLISAHEAVI